jgi:hypothetical protein
LGFALYNVGDCIIQGAKPQRVYGGKMTGNIESPICPECHRKDKVFKISQIYMESLTVFNKKDPHPVLTAMFINQDENVALPSPYSHEFTRVFAPPSGKTEIVRALHPDLIIGVFSAAILFLLYMAYNQNQAVILPSLFVLVPAYVLYFVFRKAAIQKYNDTMAEDKGEVRSVEQAIGEWMKLYYCARDGVVIEPESGKNMRLDEMKRFLLRGKLESKS